MSTEVQAENRTEQERQVDPGVVLREYSRKVVRYITRDFEEDTRKVLLEIHFAAALGGILLILINNLPG